MIEKWRLSLPADVPSIEGVEVVRYPMCDCDMVISSTGHHASITVKTEHETFTFNIFDADHIQEFHGLLMLMGYQKVSS